MFGAVAPAALEADLTLLKSSDTSMQGGTSARLYDSSRTKIQTTPVRGKSPKTWLFAETVESESRQQSAAQADRFCTHMITAASSATANIMAPWLATQDIQ